MLQRVRQTGRLTATLAVLALAFLMTAAPSGGGGGGFGGGASRGAGGSSGGSRSYSGGSSHSYSAGYASRGSSGSRSDSGSGGHASSPGGGSGGDMLMTTQDWWLFWLTVGGFGGILLASMAAPLVLAKKNRPFRLLNLVLVLKNRQDYARTLDALTRGGHFATPVQRCQALEQIASGLRAKDILDGFVAVGWPSRADELGCRAGELSREQMRTAEITHTAFNLATPAGTRREAVPARTPSSGAPPAGKGHCLLGLVVSVPERSHFSPGGVACAREVLAKLPSCYPDALFYYYAPAPGAFLSVAEAERLLEKVRVSAETACGAGKPG